MVKVRMNTADVAAEVKCLRRLIGMRCSNVYDLSPKVPKSIAFSPFFNSIIQFYGFLAIRFDFLFAFVDVYVQADQ